MVEGFCFKKSLEAQCFRFSRLAVYLQLEKSKSVSPRLLSVLGGFPAAAISTSRQTRILCKHTDPDDQIFIQKLKKKEIFFQDLMVKKNLQRCLGHTILPVL